MQITFTGPTGQTLTVADPRRDAAKAGTFALPAERSPFATIIATMKV